MGFENIQKTFHRGPVADFHKLLGKAGGCPFPVSRCQNQRPYPHRLISLILVPSYGKRGLPVKNSLDSRTIWPPVFGGFSGQTGMGLAQQPADGQTIGAWRLVTPKVHGRIHPGCGRQLRVEPSRHLGQAVSRMIHGKTENIGHRHTSGIGLLTGGAAATDVFADGRSEFAKPPVFIGGVPRQWLRYFLEARRTNRADCRMP